MTPLPQRLADLDVQTLELEKINRPHPDNPRNLPEPGSVERETLKKSLEHDYFDPVIFNKRNQRLVAGHVRVPLMIELGFTHAKVIVVDYDEVTHLARMRAANAHSGKSSKDKLELLMVKLRAANADPVLALLQNLEKPSPSKRTKSTKAPSKGAFEITVECHDDAERRRAHALLSEHGFTCRLG